MRLDLYLTQYGLCESRNKAHALIISGGVSVNGKRVIKPSFNLSEVDNVEIISNQKQYVARSAAKLITAIDEFSLKLNDKVCADFGASTGGFCEVMLEHNVKRIYAIDIGTNQLHPKIKSDYRVINKDHTNARYLSSADFDMPIDFITCDLSFISLRLILNAVYCSLTTYGECVCLVKPQFEVGPDKIGKNGVVKCLDDHVKAILTISDYASEIGFNVCDVAFSGLIGESGNKEYLLYLKKDNKPAQLDAVKVRKVVLGGL